jgi:CHRD domain-containing protein
MRRFVLLLAGLAALAVALTSANARTGATRAVCHRTASAAKPYVLLKVTPRSLRAHLNHPADIVPAPRGGCPRTLLAGTGGTAFSITLVGEAESPAGDPVATGTATVRLRAGQGQLCYKLAADNLSGPAVAAHVHKAAAGTSGPVVIPLATPGSDGKSGGCVAVARTLVAQILGAPASYYVNVHTGEFPGGAIRGQLTGTSADMAGTTITLDLKGSSEPNATGSAVLRFRKDAGLVCYRLHAANITLPALGAHIHKGPAGTNGPVVVPFTAPGAKGDSSGCSPAAGSLIDDILANRSGYYVNVHTQEHPAGAIRGQLG